MNILIAEDDFPSRLVLQELLDGLGLSHVAVNGKEAVDAVRDAFASGHPYSLICMDIKMPGMDGVTALRQIRDLEESKGIYSTEGVKVIMTTAMRDMKNVRAAFGNLCDAYLVKPIEKAELHAALRRLGLLE